MCDAGCGCVHMLMNAKDDGDGMRNHEMMMRGMLVWKLWANVDEVK